VASRRGQATLREAVISLYDVGDRDVPWFDPNAHGTAGQRIDAFNEGYRGRECTGAGFFRNVHVNLPVNDRANAGDQQSLVDALSRHVGRFTLTSVAESTPLVQRGAQAAVQAAYRAPDGEMVLFIVAAFPSERHNQRMVGEHLKGLLARGYQRGWQHPIGQGQEKGVITQLIGRDEIIILNQEGLFLYIQGSQGYATAFADAFFSPAE
jgi:hypothetical protein